MSLENLEPDTLQDALGVQDDGEPQAEPDTKPGETPEESANSEDEEGKPKREGGFQKRIRKLSQRLQEKDAIIERLLEDRGGKRTEEPAKPSITAKPEPPDEDKFDNHADFRKAQNKYFEDLADWKAEEKLRARAESDRKDSEKREAEKTRAAWGKKLDAAHQAHPDLAELLEDDLPTSPAMAQAIMESDHGGELLYHLAKHPDECRRISELSPLAAARALGKIEAAFGEKHDTRKPTNAPAPLKPVKGGGNVTTDPSKMTDSDWLKSQKRGRASA